MPSQTMPNLRDIPGLDDRLVRFLEQQANAVNQLLQIMDNQKKETDQHVNPEMSAIRDQLQAGGSAPLNITGLMPSTILQSSFDKVTAGAPFANSAYIVMLDQQGNQVKVMVTT